MAPLYFNRSQNTSVIAITQNDCSILFFILSGSFSPGCPLVAWSYSTSTSTDGTTSSNNDTNNNNNFNNEDNSNNNNSVSNNCCNYYHNEYNKKMKCFQKALRDDEEIIFNSNF